MFKRFSNLLLDEHLLFNLKGPCFDKLYFILVLITSQIIRTVESINLLIKELLKKWLFQIIKSRLTSNELLFLPSKGVETILPLVN